MGKAITFNPLFQAEWPKHLDPAQKNFYEKISWVFLNVVIFPIGLIRLTASVSRSFAYQIIYPGAGEQTVSNYGRTLKSAHGGVPIQLTTPDKEKLDGVFIKGKNPDKAIVYIGGNLQQWETQGEVVKKLKPLGTSILMINPRGVGNQSTGFGSEEGYALDMYTACEYLIHKHNIDPENILPMGFSMGGAVTVRGAELLQEKYHDKKIKALNLCSYSSLRKEIDILFKENTLFNYFIRTIVPLIGIQLNVKSAWDKLKGKKTIFYRPDDDVITLPVSLFKAVEENPIGTTRVFKMTEGTTHNDPFTLAENASMLNEIRRLLNLEKSWFSWPTLFSLKERIISQEV